jgi:hypothetical protein
MTPPTLGGILMLQPSSVSSTLECSQTIMAQQFTRPDKEFSTGGSGKAFTGMH